MLVFLLVFLESQPLFHTERRVSFCVEQWSVFEGLPPSRKGMGIFHRGKTQRFQSDTLRQNVTIVFVGEVKYGADFRVTTFSVPLKFLKDPFWLGMVGPSESLENQSASSSKSHLEF